MVFAYIRKRQKALLWIIVGLTVATFTVFSVTSAVLSFANVSREDRVASFRLPSGREISIDQTHFHSTMRLLELFQGDVDREAVLSHYMLVAAARDAGLGVSRQEINENLVQMGTQNGLYQDDAGYREFVRRRRLSPDRFQEFVGEQILVRRFVGLVEDLYSRPTDDDYYQRYREAREEFRVTLLGFPYDDFAEGLEPETEEELRSWYEDLEEAKRTAEFPAEASVSLETAVLPMEGLNEAGLRALLGEDTAQDSPGETSGEGATEEVAAGAGKGGSGELEELAKRVLQKALDDARKIERERSAESKGEGEDSPQESSPLATVAGDLGLRVARMDQPLPVSALSEIPGVGVDDGLPEELEAVWKGKWAPAPRRSDRGFYVYRVADVAAPKALSFEEAREKVVEVRRDERLRERATAAAKEVRDRIRAKARELAAAAIDPIEAEVRDAIEVRLAAAASPDDPAARESIEKEEHAKAEGRIEVLLREREGEALDLVAAEDENLDAVTLSPFPRKAPSGILGEALPKESRTLAQEPAVTSLSPGQVSAVVQDPVTKQAMIVRIDGRRFPEREEMTPRDRFDFRYQVQLEKYQQSQSRWSYNELARAFDLRIYEPTRPPSS